MKVSKNFSLQEFVSPPVFDRYQEKALWFVDDRMIQTCQKLRDNLNVPITSNNWYCGGDIDDSGLRVQGMPNYSSTSQHAFGRAVNIRSKDISVEELGHHIDQNKDSYPYITSIKRNASWLHIDFQNNKSNFAKNFSSQEFLAKETWDKYGHKALGFIDDRIIESAQALRDNLDVPLTINNWAYGGDRYMSGLRTQEMSIYRPFSQHSFGRAVDIISPEITAEKMRKHILQNQDLYPHITTLEGNVTWLHMDCRNRTEEGIQVFLP